MSMLSNSPRLSRGALVVFKPPNPMPKVILFQYNPSGLTRTVSLREEKSKSSSPREALKIYGAPRETIDIKLMLTAHDALERGDPRAHLMGLHPQLAALELLLYPSSKTVIMNAALLLAGAIEVLPPPPPFVLFVWGPNRVVPVQLKSLKITELLHDSSLNPTSAEVSTQLEVLTYSDLEPLHPGSILFLAHQIVKETMALLAEDSALGALAAGATKLM